MDNIIKNGLQNSISELKKTINSCYGLQSLEGETSTSIQSSTIKEMHILHGKLKVLLDKHKKSLF